MAEIELRVCARQCWHRRLATEAPLVHELAALEAARNTVRAPMHWQFTTPAARVKLAHLYPSPSPGQSTSNLAAFVASVVILATGGAGRVYQRSTASRSCTGDGMSLAYHAGLRLVDMEMVQNHPLGFYAHRAFASEATLAEGAMLCDAAGQPVLQVNSSLLRDSLCRTMVETGREARAGSSFLLDMRPVSRNVRASRFQYLQRIANELVGVELEQERLPVRPIAHRLLGGIETTLDGATTMPGLFATGECAWQGVHGANGLAGNTLTASVVLGQRAGAAAATHTRDHQEVGEAEGRGEIRR